MPTPSRAASRTQRRRDISQAAAGSPAEHESASRPAVRPRPRSGAVQSRGIQGMSVEDPEATQSMGQEPEQASPEVFEAAELPPITSLADLPPIRFKSRTKARKALSERPKPPEVARTDWMLGMETDESNIMDNLIKTPRLAKQKIKKKVIKKMKSPYKFISDSESSSDEEKTFRGRKMERKESDEEYLVLEAPGEQKEPDYTHSGLAVTKVINKIKPHHRYDYDPSVKVTSPRYEQYCQVTDLKHRIIDALEHVEQSLGDVCNMTRAFRRTGWHFSSDASPMERNPFGRAYTKIIKKTVEDREYLNLIKPDVIEGITYVPRYTRNLLKDAPFVRNLPEVNTDPLKPFRVKPNRRPTFDKLLSMDAIYRLIMDRKSMLNNQRDELLALTIYRMLTVTREDRVEAFKNLEKQIRRGPYDGMSREEIDRFLLEHDTDGAYRKVRKIPKYEPRQRRLYFRPHHLYEVKFGDYPQTKPYYYPDILSRLPTNGAHAPRNSPVDVARSTEWLEHMGFRNQPFTYWNIETNRTNWDSRMRKMLMYRSYLKDKHYSSDYVRHSINLRIRESFKHQEE